ncbi:MAG: septum formation initiator family protein [Gemmatimonadaceae bacterium]|nr:septum formation initiator family protein [Gemmatimonadaceae bacterium]
MPAKARGGGERLPLWLRLGLLALAASVAYFAVEGGEYGTSDLLRQRRAMATLQHQIDSLQHEVDSLTAWKKAVETDPVIQERIAREEFGMVKGPKERLYRFARPAP